MSRPIAWPTRRRSPDQGSEQSTRLSPLRLPSTAGRLRSAPSSLRVLVPEIPPRIPGPFLAFRCVHRRRAPTRYPRLAPVTGLPWRPPPASLPLVRRSRSPRPPDWFLRVPVARRCGPGGGNGADRSRCRRRQRLRGLAYDASMATSSITKEVWRDESSVPVNLRVTVKPANWDTSNARST